YREPHHRGDAEEHQVRAHHVVRPAREPRARHRDHPRSPELPAGDLTPGAQVAAAIQLLDEIERGRAPADDIVGGYFRRHRFAGSSDRAAISAHIYAVLRHRAALDWWIAKAGQG